MAPRQQNEVYKVCKYEVAARIWVLRTNQATTTTISPSPSFCKLILDLQNRHK